MRAYADGMVLHARTTEDRMLAFHVSVPLTDEDLRRLAALQEMPGMAQAVWTGRDGGVR